MSTVTVYKPHPDPVARLPRGRPARRRDGAAVRRRTRSRRSRRRPWPAYCARVLDLPITIARMGSAYGEQGGLPVWHLQAIAAGQPVRPGGIRCPTARSTTTTSPRSSNRCSTRHGAGDDRELVRRRAGQRAGVVGLLRRAARRRGRGGRHRGHPARRSALSATITSERRSPARAASTGATASGAWPSSSIRIASKPRLSDRFPSARERSLAEAVRRERGLDDFGPGDFREGLEVLLESLERDGDLSPTATPGCRRLRGDGW